MKAFESLTTMQTDSVKRIAFLYTLNFNKTNFIVRENVEI